MLEAGSKVPKVTFKTRVRDDAIEGPNPFVWKDLSSDDVFSGKKVVLFALPGAFTPTCSSTHLPGYDMKHDQLRELGIDQVICLSVNDAFVMYKWSLDLNNKNIFMLPDGNGEFTEKMGALVEKTNLGFGKRSWRYSMFVNDGVIEKVFAEEGMGDNVEGDPFEVSDVNTMLQYLQK